MLVCLSGAAILITDIVNPSHSNHMVVALIVPLAVEQLYKYTNYRKTYLWSCPVVCGLCLWLWLLSLITSENGSIQISFQRVYDV